MGDAEMVGDVLEDPNIVGYGDGAPLLPHVGDTQMPMSAPFGVLDEVAEIGVQAARPPRGDTGKRPRVEDDQDVASDIVANSLYCGGQNRGRAWAEVCHA